MFGPSAEQSEVFARSTQPLLNDSIAKGQNTLVFAYGLTKSGKTYTMFGKDGEQQGIIPRAVHTVFDRVSGGAAADITSSATDGALNSPTSLLSPASRPANPAVLVSFLEIYNDKLRDLLTKEKGDRAGRCELQNCSADGTENGEVYVKGLREVEVTSRQEAFALLKQGQRLRQKAKTELNSDSSRSHAVLTLKLLDESGHVWCRLSIVDLAGSERTNRTKTQAGDERRKEASNINQSLVVLGRCLEALRSNNKNKKQQLVPYRDSTLTRLFKDSLSGWGRTVMIVNVSQVHADYDETVLALKYASIAKEVTIVAKVDAQLDVRELKRKHRLKQMQDAANKRMEEEEEEEEEDDDDEDDGQDSDSSAEDELPVVDDEQLPVTIHQAAKRDDSREEECFELTEAVYILKQENVALRAEKAQQEQQLREQLSAEIEKQVEEAELRAKKTVEDEKQRTTKLMEAKFRLREQHMEDAATELEDRVELLQTQMKQQTEAATKHEQERAAALRQSEEARQQLNKQLEKAEAERQKEQSTGEEQRQQLTEQLQAAQAEVQTVKAELKAARQASESERAALLAQLATAEAEVAALKALLATEQGERETASKQLQAEREAVAAEQAERAQSEKRERKDRDDRDKQREKELTRERNEWEKARKAAEKERSKREKEVEAAQADMEEKLQQLQAELDTALAAHEDSSKQWLQQESEHKKRLSDLLAEAKDKQTAYQKETDALVKEKEAQTDATLAWSRGEHEKQTAELRAEIDKCSQRIEELEEQKRDIERKRQAEAAMRVKEEGARQEEEQRREHERLAHQEQLLLLAQFEAVRAEYNKKEDKALATPAFIALIQSLLDNHSKPTAITAPSVQPASIVAQTAKVAAASIASSASVTVQPPAAAVTAPPIVPVASSPAAVAAPATASLPPVPPAKPARTRKGSKASKRDSMDDFYDGYDEKLVSAAIAHASLDSNNNPAGVTSGLAAFAKKAKARLSSATDSLRFNSSRTAPASSLHHALNESKAAALIASAAAATVESATSAAAANNRVLLSPQVQRALKASGRRSRSKSRKGKENEEAADPYDFERALAADGAADKESSKVRKASKKKREQELLAAALSKTTAAAPLSDSAHFDRVVSDNSTALQPVVKYGRQQPPLASSGSSNISSNHTAPELPMKPRMPQAAPTPVAKRTRQHTGSK